MRTLFLSLLLLSIPCLAQDEGIAPPPIAGTYHGQAQNGLALEPVTTTFRIASGGRLAGEYVVGSGSGSFPGTISSTTFEDPYTLSVEWTDRDGEGWAQFEFAPDYNSFTGFWGIYGSEQTHPWTGTRQ